MSTAKDMSHGQICCRALDIVMVRFASRQQRIGIALEIMLSVSDGRKARKAVVLRFPKARRGEPDDFADATYAYVNHCPFCGKKIHEAGQ